MNNVYKKNVDEEMKNSITELYVDEYIVPDTYCEKDVFDKMRHNRDEEKNVVMYFIPTFDCNFRCPYCIVSSTNHSCSKFQNIMSDEDVLKSAQWLINYVLENNLKSLTVELFGGEPLIAHKQNLLFLNTLNILKEKGVELNLNMISNCYTLSEKRLSELKQAGIKLIQCTIDGPKEIHDKRRILTNGKGSFDKIIENIKKCQKYNIGLTIRINIDEENAPYIIELIDFLAENQFNDYATIGLAPVDPPLDDVNITGHTNGTMKYVHSIFQRLREHHFRFRLWETFCGNGTKNFFVICPDGKMYNCPSYAGMEGFEVGNIHESGFYISRPQMHDIPEKCYSCNLVGVCSGGCYFIKNVHNISDDYCLKPTHSVMVEGYASAKYKD